MNSYIKSIVPIIEARYDSLTNVEKNIADFFINNKEDMDFGSECSQDDICIRSITFEICEEVRIPRIPGIYLSV